MAGITPSADEIPTPAEFEQEADSIILEGLAPVALHAIGQRPEHRDRQYTAEFRRLTLMAGLRSMTADATGSRFLRELARFDIPVAVIKGPAMARLHPSDWPRTYSDIDVLISSTRFREALEVGRSRGYLPPDRGMPQRKYFDLMCREGINIHSAAGGNIDFHHHLPPWALGSHISVESIIERSEQRELLGVPLGFAQPTDLLVASALHVFNDLWKDKSGLMSWRDMIVIMNGIGPQRARTAFEEGDLTWLYDLMLNELTAAIPQLGLPRTTFTTAPNPAQRMRLAALGWTGDSSPTRHRLAWAARLPPLNALAFLAGVAFPSAEYIRTRQGSYRHYWTRALSETLSTAHGSDFRMSTIDHLS